jgi:hypothetical protein
MDQLLIDDRPQPEWRTEPVPKRGLTHTTLETRLFRAIEAAFEVDRDDLCQSSRGRSKVAFARQTAMYLARVTLGRTLADAALLVGRDRTTAAHACRVVEDRRDDPGFDSLLDAMEIFVLRATAMPEERKR